MSTVTVSMSGLAEAHTAVSSHTDRHVIVGFEHPHASVLLHGELDVVRQLLTDGVAQLDAIAAQHPEVGQ